MQPIHKSLQLSFEESYHFLHHLYKQQDLALRLNKDKKSLVGEDSEQTKIIEFKFPLSFPVIEEKESLDEYIDKIEEYPPEYLILLIQAGQAALGYFEEGEMVSHKVIRKYMVRAKQGKLQLAHLKTKGKSKLGSRIRLAQSIEFFEEINEKLQEWEVEEVKHILYSSSIQLWNALFESKVSSPFEKRDERLYKIPKDVQTPTYEELMKINRFTLQGYVDLYQTMSPDFFEEDRD